MAKATSVATIIAPGVIPAHWQTVNVSFYGFATAAAVAPNDIVVIKLITKSFTVGQAVDSNNVGHGNVSQAMPSTVRVAVKTQVSTGFAVDPGSFLRLSITRMNDAADTLPGNYRFMGATIERVT
jgi:hypothetical protein